MARYHYTIPWVVLDSTTGTLVTNRRDGILYDVDGQEVAAYSPGGYITKVVTGPAGTTAPFEADVPIGRVRFGETYAGVWADEQANALPMAQAASDAAEAALDRVRDVATTATEVSYISRDIDGNVWVHDEPVIDGTAGYPRLDVSGDLYIDFPT